MLLSKAFGVCAFATSVLADGASIVNALTTIDDDTIALGNLVESWTGNLAGTIPIVGESATLLADIGKGTLVADASPPLSFDDALLVAGAVAGLAYDVNTTLSELIAVKPEADKLIVISPVILGDLKLQQTATNALGKAIIAKTPASLLGAAQELLQPIDDSFTQAIDVYSDLF